MGDGVEFYNMPDLSGPIEWAPIVEGAYAVVHLAGIAHATARIPLDTYMIVNTDATHRLAQTAKATGVERFVFVSSIRAQTGFNADSVLTERSPPAPTDAYGISKLEAERRIVASGCCYKILRPVVMYGPHAKGNMRKLLCLARLPVPLPLRGLQGRRSFLSVFNLASAVTFVLSDQDDTSQTYVVADRTALTIPAAIDALRDGLSVRAPQFTIPGWALRSTLAMVGKADVWPQMTGDLIVSAGRLLADGWDPLMDAPDGLRLYGEWARTWSQP